MGAQAKLFSLNTTFKFYTEPYIDTYENNETDSTNSFYNFNNIYSSLHAPAYIAGCGAYFTLSEQEFYGMYPKEQSIVSVATGNGSTTAYSGTLSSTPILRNNVLFSSINASNAGLKAYDNGSGTLTGDVTGTATIDYITGAYSLTFTSAPASGKDVYAQTIPYTQSTPQAILYHNNKVILRPVPDKVYQVEISAYMRPTYLLSSTSVPEIASWWQYIAYGAAKKIFEDRMDMDSVSLILPEFDKQERLMLRRTIVQQSDQRVATIYSTPGDGVNYGEDNF